MKVPLIILIGFFLSCFVANTQSPIYLHLVPHTHNDLGWLYTVKSYYLGQNPRGCVECILDSVMATLSTNPNRRFSYVEMGYFKIWWSQQNATNQQKVIDLYKNGQFELLNAGIVMNDEGAAYYDDIIEQMSKGLKFVKDTFNYTVKVGWHIDIFGHTAAQASIFSEMGFNSWFFERIDYQDFNNRLANHNMETLWQPKSFLDLNYVLTHVDYMSYYLAPFNWCLDMICFPSNSPFDSMQKLFKYSTWVQNQTNFYLSNNILHQIGGDFEWSGDAENLFEGLEVLIDFFHAHQEFDIIPSFSTPSTYTDNLYQEVLNNRTRPLTTKEDDFLSYVDVPHAYWTGYYTSRAVYKQKVRAGGQRLQSVRKLLSKMLLERPSYFEQNYNDFQTSLDQYEEINAILQHHDSITGTAKQAVTNNYVNMLSCAADSIDQVLNSIVANYTKDNLGEDLAYTECKLNAPVCEAVYHALLSFESAVVTVYNPSSQTKNLIKIQVPKMQLNVTDENNNSVDADIICDDYNAPLVCTLYFYTDIPTNSLAAYKVTIGDIAHSNIVPPVTLQNATNFTRSSYTLMASANMTDFILSYNGAEYPFSLNYKYYQSYYADNEQVSGAYIFRPAQNYSLPYSKVVDGRFFVGKNLVEIQIRGTTVISAIKLTDSVNYGAPVIQVDTLTLPVDISDGIGKELTINFLSPNINNQQTFYTDSNGLYMTKRTLNHRETYNVQLTEPVAGNYFPVYSSIYIEDPTTSQRMTVVNDRTQGGSSLNNGEIELMLHRRILHDDNRGVDEALNETDANGVGIQVKLTHYLFFSKGDLQQTQRQIQYDLDNQKLVFVSASSSKRFTLPHKKENTESLPSLVKFYVRPFSDTNYLVRLHSLNDYDDLTIDLVDSNGNPVVLSHLIGDNYKDYSVSSIEELSLGANQNRQEMLNSKYKWDKNFSPVPVNDDQNTTTLAPMQMRVFNFVLTKTGGPSKNFVVRQNPESQVKPCGDDCIFSVTEDDPDAQKPTKSTEDKNENPAGVESEKVNNGLGVQIKDRKSKFKIRPQSKYGHMNNTKLKGKALIRIYDVELKLL